MHSLRYTLQRRLTLVLMLVLLLGTWLTPAAAAQSEPAQTVNSGLRVVAQDGGLQFQWQGGLAAQAATGVPELPLQAYNGYLLPWQSTLVELPQTDTTGTAAASSAISIAALNSVPFTGELTPAPVEMPPAIGWEPLPAFFPQPTFELPDAPIFVVAEGTQRGQHLATVAFSPIYRDPSSGEVRYVESLSAQVAGASVATLDDAVADPATSTLFTPVPALTDATGPSNGLAARSNVVKLTVANAGMQAIDGGAIAAAGLSGPSTNKLRLLLRGQEIPLHIIDRNNNNVLDAADQIRFYAPVVGDRYNTTSVYWLYESGQNGVRMGTRSVDPAGATPRSTALEAGTYNASTEFESTLPGDDDDNFFIKKADTQPDESKAPANVTFAATLAHQLPLKNSADLDAIIALHTTVYDTKRNGDVPHRLRVKLGSTAQTDAWSVDFNLGRAQNFVRTIELDTSDNQLDVTLLADDRRLGVAFDAIDYLLPAQLTFNNKGATFQGVDGTWRYQLSGTAANRALYDITDPDQPQLLLLDQELPDSANFTFQDQDAKRYLVTGPGTLFTPAAAAHTPVNFNANGSAHIIYITPDLFRSTLQPLVDLRTSQNYVTRVVDVQNIFDAWGYGMVDPAAIRAFLRFAVGNWNPAPLAAVLVGDGTWDPHNYLGFGNSDFIPPYMLKVDDYIGHTACDSCYGQLDRAVPTDEVLFLPDIWIGRFPVSSVSQLTGIIDKIVAYEKDSNDQATWRRRSIQIADDFVRPDGSIDNAGNFPALVEEIIVEQPEGIESIRHFYSAVQDFGFLTEPLRSILEGFQPYFEGDVTTALNRSVQLMNGGAGIVTYTGHSNHWQWSVTDASQVDNLFDARLFGLYDAGRLTNTDMPFIALSMTCYTSQFAKPAPDPKVLDEDLFLHRNGGAIATIGSSGLSVTLGHDTLQRGFYHQLWSSPRQKAKMGALLNAGFKEVAKSGKNLDVNRTFLLLGDPFMPARVQELSVLHVPVIQNELDLP